MDNRRTFPARPKKQSIAAPAAATAMAFILAYILGESLKIKPDQGAGYWMGALGGIFMLAAMAAYPARKNFKALARFGSMKAWLNFHIFLGTAGPVMVLAHSRFDLRALNSKVAFAAMVTVALSGVVGRFLLMAATRDAHNARAWLDDPDCLASFAQRWAACPQGARLLAQAEARILAEAAKATPWTLASGWGAGSSEKREALQAVHLFC